MLFRQQCTEFFPVQCCRESPGQYCPFTCIMLSQEFYDNIGQDFFMCNSAWGLLDNIAQGFFPVNVVQNIKTTLNRNFSCAMLSGVSLGQHCTRFLPVPCIKTTLNKDFSCVMLAGAFWTTLYDVFACAMFTHG